MARTVQEILEEFRGRGLVCPHCGGPKTAHARHCLSCQVEAVADYRRAAALATGRA